MRFTTLILATVLALPAFGNSFLGVWSVSAVDPEGQVHKSEMTIEQDGSGLKGSVKAGQYAIPMRDVQLQGEELVFKLPWEGMTLTIKLRASGDELKGTFTTPEGDSGPITAKRTGGAPAAAGESVAGRWKVTAVTGGGREMKIDLELKEAEGKWTGNLVTPDGMMLPLSEIAAAGREVSFKIPTDQGSFLIKMALEGGSMTGSYTTPDGTTGKITATR